jgi:glutamine cyclotransferase
MSRFPHSVSLVTLVAVVLLSCAAVREKDWDPGSVGLPETQAAARLVDTPSGVRQPAPTTSRPSSIGPVDGVTSGPIPTYGFRVINEYPHDPEAFTQGLVYEDGFLYEGTGLWGASTLRKVDLETGQIIEGYYYELPDDYFGEGITIWADQIIQLTWQSNLGFVYDKASFELLDEFEYPGQGWGITHDGTHLIMSDGSDTLRFWDPDTLAQVGYVDVYDDQGPVVYLNELEYIEGQVYANVWQTNLIAIIDPQTGQVTAWLDLTGLLSPEDCSQPVNVLNGIAYDAQGDRLFVTGKRWCKLFEIELIPPSFVFLPSVRR